MSWLNTIFIFVVSFLAIFWEAVFPGTRRLLGAQVDLLPPLLVYASLTAGISAVTSLAVLSGLWFDSLSANPLGVSVLPFSLIALSIYAYRELILRDQIFAQLTLGLAASTLAPGLTLVCLLTTNRTPLFGWGTLWQLVVMAVGGAVITPVLFELFRLLNSALGYRRSTETSFRPDREIRRGR